MNDLGLNALDGGRAAAASPTRATSGHAPLKTGSAAAAAEGQARPQSAATETASPPARQGLDLEALQKLVAEINLKVPRERGIRFDVSGEGKDLVVQVVDKGSDEVIREIPPDRLRGLRSFFQDLTGALLDDRA
ncbi:MAG: flagellar protein FlaG [Planctomycetota bacterium]